MRETARPFGVELSLFEDTAMRDAVAELVVDADRIQFADPRSATSSPRGCTR